MTAVTRSSVPHSLICIAPSQCGASIHVLSVISCPHRILVSEYSLTCFCVIIVYIFDKMCLYIYYV